MRLIIVLAVLLLALSAHARDVTLAWDATSGAEAYNVYRAELSAGAWSAWQQIATNQTATTYIDTTAPELPTCAMWVVTSTAGQVESGASNVAEDCPPESPPAPPMNTRIAVP